MGKKTEAFTNDVKALSQTCQTIFDALLLQLTEYQKSVVKLEAAQNEWEARRREMEQTGEKGYSQEPLYKKMNSIWSGKGMDRNHGMHLADKLRQAASDLSKKLVVFKAFIDKKARSKNPFKSKKSLPGALATISEYEGVVAMMNSAADEIYQAFRG
jgi:hypothetical protein